MGLIDIKGIWKSTVKEDQIKFNLLQSEMALSLYKVYSDERKAKYPSSSSESAADNILYRHTSIYDMVIFIQIPIIFTLYNNDIT